MIKAIVISTILISVNIYASKYAIVVNQKNKISKISKQQIKAIFLKKRHYIDDQKIIPVNISANSSVRLYFEKTILKMSRDDLNGFWTKQHFQGVTPPTTQSSGNSAKLFIKNVDGAIGYLPMNLIDKDIKVIYEF